MWGATGRCGNPTNFPRKVRPKNARFPNPTHRLVCQHKTDPFLRQSAYKRGVNYFFAYSMDDDQIGDYLDGLAELCSDPMTRGKIFVAVGMEDFSNREAVTTHVEKCLSRLRTDYVDAFFLEYVCRGDEDAANETMGWMRGAGGLVVAEGAGLSQSPHTASAIAHTRPDEGTVISDWLRNTRYERLTLSAFIVSARTRTLKTRTCPWNKRGRISRRLMRRRKRCGTRCERELRRSQPWPNP